MSVSVSATVDAMTAVTAMVTSAMSTPSAVAALMGTTTVLVKAAPPPKHCSSASGDRAAHPGSGSLSVLLAVSPMGTG